MNKMRKLEETKILFDDDLNILTIENGVPSYYQINLINTSKKLHIGIPEEYRIKISSDIEFYNNISFDGTCSFNDLAKKTGIDKLEELIKEHSIKIAKNFADKTNGCKFYGNKYGVFDIDIGERIGVHELPIANVRTFETDYFTFRVFSSIYEVVRREYNLDKVSNLNELLKYNCFMCSIGINAIVTVDSKKFNKEELLITKRSSNTISYHNMYHISVMEGLCNLDYDEYTGNVSVQKCLSRGIEEELGIPQIYHLQNNTEFKYWDLFLCKDTYNFGITCYVSIKGLYFDDIRSVYAKDRKFEIDEVESIPSSKSNLENYIRGKNFVPQGLYTLNSYAIRKFGKAIEISSKHKK